MAFNKNELILDRVLSLTAHDLSTGEMLMRITSLEEPSLNCTAEGEEVTDAVGAVITTLYRAKKGEFTATNSLISLDLAAAQYGTKKQVAEADGKEIIDYTYEILDVKGTEAETGIKLKKKPLDHNAIKFAYEIVSGEIGKTFKAGSVANATDFVVDETGKVTPPSDFKGKLYIEYTYKAENAVLVRNSASNFPEACSIVVYALFRDKCNENLVYYGKIIAPKAKLNPESVELALTATGKHPFTFTFMKDYCAEAGDDTLFDIIVAE